MVVYKLNESEIAQLEGTILSTGALINLNIKDKHGNTIISQQQYDSVQVGEPIIYEPIEQEEDEF